MRDRSPPSKVIGLNGPFMDKRVKWPVADKNHAKKQVSLAKLKFKSQNY